MLRQYHPASPDRTTSHSIQDNLGSKGLSLPSPPAIRPIIQRVKGLQKDTPVFIVDYGEYYRARILGSAGNTYTAKLIESNREIEVEEHWVVTNEWEAQKMVAEGREIDIKSHIFGLDGKDERALDIAIGNGYRIFDMAETYAVGLDKLMQAIARHNIPRQAITIIYKIGHSKGNEDVSAAALKGIQIAGGYIDILMLHENPGNDRLLKSNLEILQWLKKDGKIIRAGISNITSFDLEQLGDLNAITDITVIQDQYNLNNAETIEQSGSSAEGLLKKANPRERIIKMGYSILENRKELNPDPGFLEKYKITVEQAISIWARKKGYVPVNSSSTEKSNQSNLEVTNERFNEVWKLKAGDIEQALKGSIPAKEEKVPIDDPVVGKLKTTGLDGVYLAAKSGALTNDLDHVLIELDKAPPFVKTIILPKLPLLWSNDEEEQNYKKRFAYITDITQERLNGFACNKKKICNAIVKTLAQYSTNY